MTSPRVTELRALALAVPDLAAEVAFFRDTWGLTVVDEADGRVFLGAEGSPEHHVLRLRQDADRMTDLIAFAAPDRAAVDALHFHLGQMGVKLIDNAPRDIAEPGGGYGFRFFDPDGRAIEVSSDVVTRATRAIAAGEAIPERLSHVVIHTPDVRALAEFYQAALGFRVSDWIGDVMCLLRCSTAHHRLAILPGPPCLNHVAFDVASIDDMMRGLGRMLKAGVELQWGPGRHVAGNNAFSYFITPNGNTVELTSDLEEIDEATWRPHTYRFSPEITDQWGTSEIHKPVSHPAMAPDAGLWRVPT